MKDAPCIESYLPTFPQSANRGKCNFPIIKSFFIFHEEFLFFQLMQRSGLAIAAVTFLHSKKV
jgi:hypothetical protein